MTACSAGSGFSLAARLTSRSRSICEHRPSVTGSSGVQIRRVPVRALPDGGDGRLGRADQPHDCAVLQLRMVAHEPENGVGAVLAPRHRRVARAALLLRLRHAQLGMGELQPRSLVGFGALDLVAGELAGEDRVEPLDALRRVTVGDRLYFERVQLAEIGDLIERQGRVLDQPDGGGFRHQRLVRHAGISLALRPPQAAKPLLDREMAEDGPYIGDERAARQPIGAA